MITNPGQAGSHATGPTPHGAIPRPQTQPGTHQPASRRRSRRYAPPHGGGPPVRADIASPRLPQRRISHAPDRARNGAICIPDGTEPATGRPAPIRQGDCG